MPRAEAVHRDGGPGRKQLPGGGRPAAENGQMFHQKITPLALGFQTKNSHGGVEKQN